MRIKLKNGAKLNDLKAEMVFVILSVAEVFKELGLKELVVTEGTGGKHKQGSQHYNGLGLDIRSKNIPSKLKHKIVDLVKEDLGKDYYIFLEAEGSVNEHFHLQKNKT